MSIEKADIKAGDPVIVQRYHGGPIKATVQHVARVYVTMQADDALYPGLPPLTWRMRIDTQSEHFNPSTGSGTYVARFWTLEQWEQKERKKRAFTFLREQGIEVRPASPWRDREVELAELINEALKGEQQ